MMLRINKVIGGTNATDPHPSADRPLHACLATATHFEGGGTNDDGDSGNTNSGGEIATVGRKNCIVAIDDKCVSRKHAVIALLSNRPLLHEEAVAAMRSSSSSLLHLDGRPVMEFGKPSTPEEVHACETSSAGVICVIKDMGSKFGTYVSVDEVLLQKYHTSGNDKNNNNKASQGEGNDGDDTADETDDEGVDARRMDYVELTERQIRAVGLLDFDNDAANNNNASSSSSSSLPKFRKLREKESVPLLQLSHSDKQEVTVLFGPQGSAIRLSLVPLVFTFSRIKMLHHDSDPILSALHYIGASHSQQWDVKRSTHLIAQEKIAGAKVKQ